MASWLDQASRAFGGGAAAATEPQPYQLVCVCGTSVSGTRQPRFQQVACPQCGELLFVLPADVSLRPASPPPPRKKGKKKKKRTERAAASVPDRAVASEPRPTGSVVVRAWRNSAGTGAAAWLGRLTARCRRSVSSFSLVLLLAVLTVTATGLWILHRRALERAEVTLRTAGESGEAALQQQDFLKAEREFRRAGEAALLLGRDDLLSRTVVQRMWETTALNALVPVSLFDLVAEAERRTEANDAEWADDFRVRYRDRWLVIGTTLERSVDAEGEARFVLDCPLMIGVRAVSFDASLKAFERLPLEEGPQPVLFAAQLDDCRPTTGPGGRRWEIVLRPDSGFLWCGVETARALGFDLDDPESGHDIRLVLEAQTRLLQAGLEEEGR